MNSIQDLNLEKEILPLFNFTLNDFSKKALLHILNNPLSSKSEIIERQNVLNGFLENNNILNDYSYSPLYLKEVHNFLTHFSYDKKRENSLKYRILISKKEKYQRQSKLIQLVLFFYRIHSYYFKRINTTHFSMDYKKKLQNLNDFFIGFNLDHYEFLIREQKIKDKHFKEISEIISKLKESVQISEFWEEFFLFEAYLSISIGVFKHNYNFPKIGTSQLSLSSFYHPALKNPIENSFDSNSNVILLTGPNMSGKSTLLKAISLCNYLGHVGFAIPALKAEIPLFHNFAIHINHRDNLLNGYSHFMTEVKNLKNIALKAANNENCFAVFDELFNGTNAEDAFDIISTTLTGLTQFNKSIFFISSHLQQLKEIDEVSNKNVSSYYIDCVLKNQTPTFTYKLKKGWSDIKVGKILFEKEGLVDILKTK